MVEERVAGGKLLDAAFGPSAQQIFKQVKAVHIAACGTSFHAGLVASYFIEQICRIPARIEIASEYRYRDPVITPDTLFVTISQSGETADTLAALRNAKRAQYLSTLTICNVGESSMVRESDLVLLTRAGPEIGVASTNSLRSSIFPRVMRETSSKSSIRRTMWLTWRSIISWMRSAAGPLPPDIRRM